MGYRTIDPDDVEPMDDRPCETRPIADAAGLGNLGCRLYRVDPGEQIPLAYHYHDEQEEFFYVVSGRLHVETPDGEFVVPAGQLFVADPESPHRAFAPGDADESAVVLAAGAPRVDDVHPYEPS